MKNNTLKNIGFQLLLLVVVSAGLIWGSLKALDIYTHHDDYIVVPNVVGVEFDEAQINLENAGLRFKIIDSVYDENAKPYSIVEQNPKAGDNAKVDRTIYLVINTGNKPKVKAPNLVDMSITLAKAVIKNRGLKLGKIELGYDPIGNNLVLAQFHKGDTLEPGSFVLKGSKVDLLVASTDKDQFPDLDTMGMDSFLLIENSIEPLED